MFVVKVLKAFVVLTLLLAIGSAAAYTEISTLITVDVNSDASAHVREQYSLFLDVNEVEAFENLRKFGSNTVIGWRRFLPALKYHLASGATPANTRVSARRLLDIGARSAEIVLEYDVEAPFFKPAQVGGRTTRYSLDSSALAFDKSESGDVILTSITTLEFVLPSNAVLEKTSIAPPASASGNKVQWTGPLTGSWSLAYRIEKPLGDEVREYFSSLYNNAYSLIPTLLPIALLLLLAAFLYSKHLRTSA